MALFVRATALRTGAAMTVFLGRIVALEQSMTSDHVLIDLRTREPVSYMERYPRWLESELLLFARHLEAAGPVAGLEAFLDCEVEVALQVDIDSGAIIDREVLRIRSLSGGSVYSVSILSPYRLASNVIVCLPEPASIRNRVLRSLIAVFGTLASLPPIPAALTEVVFHQRRDGSEYVLLRDIPPVARQFVRTHFGLTRHARGLEGCLWRAFMEQWGPDGLILNTPEYAPRIMGS